VSGPESFDSDVELRFESLVQSPLRAALLRHFAGAGDRSFDLPALLAAFGRMRLDVDNCVRDLVSAGLVRAEVREGRRRPTASTRRGTSGCGARSTPSSSSVRRRRTKSARQRCAVSGS
jgi:hypothetical protein